MPEIPKKERKFILENTIKLPQWHVIVFPTIQETKQTLLYLIMIPMGKSSYTSSFIILMVCDCSTFTISYFC